jgi:hypothetical protein
MGNEGLVFIIQTGIVIMGGDFHCVSMLERKSITLILLFQNLFSPNM